MRLYVICDGATILRYGHASQRQIDAMSATLRPGEALHLVQEDFLGSLSDVTHEWDAETEAVVAMPE